jgi:hypothetical protein
VTVDEMLQSINASVVGCVRRGEPQPDCNPLRPPDPCCTAKPGA